MSYGSDGSSTNSVSLGEELGDSALARAVLVSVVRL